MKKDNIIECLNHIIENGCITIACDECPLYTKKGGQNTQKTKKMNILCNVIQSLT